MLKKNKKQQQNNAFNDKQEIARKLIMKPVKDGEIRIISVSSDEDDSEIDIDPNSEIVDQFGLDKT